MAAYDSDSSDGGDEYTETNVLLGYASKDGSSDPISHLGGHATWIDGQTAPSGALAKCRVCNGLLTLLLELNGDLPDRFPGHQRRLYIWGCRRKTCRRKNGSVRGWRGVRAAKGSVDKQNADKQDADKQDAVTQARPLQPRLGEALFGVKSPPAHPFANPFASSGAATMPTNPFAAKTPAISVTQDEQADQASLGLPETFASKAHISSPAPTAPVARPHEPWPAESAFPSPYPQYYLDAEYETLDAPSKPQIPESARVDMDADGGGGGAAKEDKEVFESSLDKTFQRFADRVGQNPEQVIRYEYGGKPLLYSDSDSVGKLLAPHAEKAASSNAKITTTAARSGSGMSPCSNCGADRVFEVQLTPHAITELEAEDMNMDGMEWGTVILGVCSQDCMPGDVSEGQVGYVEEWVGVQWEEIASKR